MWVIIISSRLTLQTNVRDGLLRNINNNKVEFEQTLTDTFKTQRQRNISRKQYLENKHASNYTQYTIRMY